MSRHSEKTDVLYKVTLSNSNFEEANSSYSHFTSVLVYKRFVYRLLDPMNGLEFDYMDGLHEVINKAISSDSFIVDKHEISEIL